jgi:hypothetical protein
MRGKKTLFLCVYKFRKNVFFGVMEIALGNCGLILTTEIATLPQPGPGIRNARTESCRKNRTVCLKCFPL